MRKTSSECFPAAIFFLTIWASPALSQDPSTTPSSPTEDESTSNKGDGANSPAAYYNNSNRVIPGSEVLFTQCFPDSVQTKHFDWGFRLAQFWGQDYRYTTSKGFFFAQLLRLEHSYDLATYDLGTKKTQFIAAADLTNHF
jgi:hypothetical protein